MRCEMAKRKIRPGEWERSCGTWGAAVLRPYTSGVAVEKIQSDIELNVEEDGFAGALQDDVPLEI